MIRRCSDPDHAKFSLYGGRGIDVATVWLENFWSFVADMGPRPPGHTLDRIDVDANYGPENCRWATIGEQRANQRRVAGHSGPHF
jgi:hypothetical protein